MLARLCRRLSVWGYYVTNHVVKTMQKQEKGRGTLTTFWNLSGGYCNTPLVIFLNLPYFSAVQQSFSLSRFTYFNSLKLHVEFCSDLMKLVIKESATAPKCAAFHSISGCLMYHFLTVMTVVWLVAVDALFAEDDERVSTRSQPFERTTEFYACTGMGTYFSINIFCFELYCVITSNFIMKKKSIITTLFP